MLRRNRLRRKRKQDIIEKIIRENKKQSKNIRKVIKKHIKRF